MDKKWVDQMSHEIKVMIVSRLNLGGPDIRPSDAYALIGKALIEDGQYLAKSTEKRSGLAN